MPLIILVESFRSASRDCSLYNEMLMIFNCYIGRATTSILNTIPCVIAVNIFQEIGQINLVLPTSCPSIRSNGTAIVRVERRDCTNRLVSGDDHRACKDICAVGHGPIVTAAACWDRIHIADCDRAIVVIRGPCNRSLRRARIKYSEARAIAIF